MLRIILNLSIQHNCRFNYGTDYMSVHFEQLHQCDPFTIVHIKRQNKYKPKSTFVKWSLSSFIDKS